MYRYIIRRLIQSIPTFFGITILAFILMIATPGGPEGALAFNLAAGGGGNQGGNSSSTSAGTGTGLNARDAIEMRLGTNDPILARYLKWLIGDDWMRVDTDDDGFADVGRLVSPTFIASNGEEIAYRAGERYGILRGDFGFTFNGRPVLDVLTENIPATLELSIASLILATVFGILVGIFAAIGRGGVFDNFTRVFAVIINAIPNFWLGLLILLAFSFTPIIDTNGDGIADRGLLPTGGRCKATIDDGCPPIIERIDHMFLPVMLLSLGGIAGTSRIMRASMLDVVSQDYIRTARSKGLSNRRVWLRHGMRNALIPIATGLGPAITGVFGGAVITEQIFNYQGVGLKTLEAITQRDYNVVMAFTIYAAIATIIGYLISDILYAIIDPRIRY
ncbi:MAG: ABC transporter permease [Anaerolineae bacterium]|nr:ABC transporter permease [Anaerolineae bacterium]